MNKVKREGLESDNDQNIITQLRKCANLRCKFEVFFENDDQVWMDPAVAAICLRIYQDLRTTIEKETMLRRIAASFQSFCDCLEGKPVPIVLPPTQLRAYDPKYFS